MIKTRAIWWNCFDMSQFLVLSSNLIWKIKVLTKERSNKNMEYALMLQNCRFEESTSDFHVELLVTRQEALLKINFSLETLNSICNF